MNTKCTSENCKAACRKCYATCEYCNQVTDLHDISVDEDTPHPQGKMICDYCRSRLWNEYTFPTDDEINEAIKSGYIGTDATMAFLRRVK